MSSLMQKCFLGCWAVLLLLYGGCSPSIDLPTPVELKVEQLAGVTKPTVEISWKLVIRVDGYLLHWDDDGSGPPYHGKGLGMVRWPGGCGHFEVKVAGQHADSPVLIPERWCLEQQNTFTDAGWVPTPTPGSRPRVRLEGLVPGKAYYFAVQVYRRDAVSAISEEFVKLIVGSK